MSDAAIIGGGPAGAALAVRLARAGRHVVLFERDPGPADKVCGEFLSREAVTYLEILGLDLRGLGAVAIDAVRLVDGDRVAEVELPFSALSLSRRVLDEALLELAAAAGCELRRGQRVHGLERASGGAGWQVRLDDDTHHGAAAAFLATGKHDVRGHQRPPGRQDDLVAFKLHWVLSPEQTAALSGAVELVMFEGGYAGLQRVEAGRANLCLVVRRSRLREVGARWSSVLAAMRAESPHLDRRLAGAEPRWAKPLALSRIPYGHVRRHADGLWRLGDQAAVIPSFSGDGMSIALHSAALAAHTVLAGGTAEAYQRQLARDVSRQVALATACSQALVRRPGQVVLGAVARAWPGLMSSVALGTRVRDAAMARTTAGARA